MFCLLNFFGGRFKAKHHYYKQIINNLEKKRYNTLAFSALTLLVGRQ